MSYTLYDLKITLNMSDPEVWRRCTVPGRMTLDELHDTLQIVMGWDNVHMYQLIIEDNFYSEDELGTEGAREKAANFRLEQVLKRAKKNFLYEYDFANGWEHDVYIEKIHTTDDLSEYPKCTEGENACPPEECGGIFSYLELIAALKDKDHPDHQKAVEEQGKNFDPYRFDPDWVNQNLKELL